MPLSPSAHVDSFCRDLLPPSDQWPDLLFSLPALAYGSTLNCGTELLDGGVERFGAERSCIVAEDGTSWTYGELLARANQIANVLVDDLGVVPGNRVLLRGPNSPALVACWFAVVKAGAVAVTTMPMLRAAELRPIVARAEPTAALCDHRLLGELADAAPALPTVAYGGDDATDLSKRSASKPAVFADVATAADDVVFIAFTSGTTGQPKACAQFHRDVLATADTFSAHVLRPNADDLFTGSPPLGFTFGLGAELVFPLRVGAATLMIEQPTPDRLAEAIGRHGVTVLSTAPTAYRALLKLDGADLSSLRRCVSAGETLLKATWEAFHDATGVRIIDGIGSTEMLHIFIASADDDIRPGSTGRVVPGYEAMIIDDDGIPVPDGTVGRLAVRGPTGCRYLDDPRQATYVRDGWNVTGDAYLRDADGYFWYQARTDDMIISAGYNIAGPEVEAALLGHPDVSEVGVVGAPDRERGMIVKAFVVLREGATADAVTAAALQDHVKATIAPYKYPRAIEFVDSLPKTATGKLQRYKLRDTR